MSSAIKILSWNYHKLTNTFKTNALREMVNENDIDVVILQEASGYGIASTLSSTHKEIDYFDGKKSNGVRVFLKIGVFTYNPAPLGWFNKYALVSLKKIKDNEWINIVAVYLYSKVGRTERKQMWENLDFIKKIEVWENTTGNKKSILIGDFNHNPFEANMLDPNVLNAKDARSLINAHRQFKTANEKDDFWYNPMWNLLGDFDYNTNKERVTGTYYRNNFDETPIWNMLDGFMLRPDLMNRVNYKDSKIITSTSSYNFIKPTIIGEAESLIHDDFSDHLPVMLSINVN